MDILYNAWLDTSRIILSIVILFDIILIYTILLCIILYMTYLIIKICK